jgi:hypothetical protein
VEAAPVERAPRWARRFVAVYLAAFCLAGLLGLEAAWPLTGWRLFADVRRDHQTAVRAYVVTPDRREVGLPFWRLPASHRGAVQVLARMEGSSPARREATCRAWAEALESLGVDVAAIAIYRVEWDLSPRVGDRAAPATHRTPLGRCAEASP